MLERFSQLNERISNHPVSKIAVIVLRIVVGATFIFSGFVKAIDPMGSVYKFHEYISALGFYNLAGSEVFLAFAVPILELVLGVMVLTGCCRYGAPLVMMAMMGIMLPLTYFLAKTNAVADCGCFGDAVKLSNWATFWKNVALTISILYLLFHNKSMPSLYGTSIQWIVMIITFILALTITYIGYNTQPLLDFRPFKVGSKISSDISPLGEDDFVWIYEKDGVEQEFTLDNIPNEEDGWNFVDRRKVTPDITPAQKAAMTTFSIYDEGTDITEEVIDTTSSQLMVLIPDLTRVNKAYAFVLNDIYEECKKQDAQFCIVTSALTQEIDQWKDLTSPSYPIYTADDSEIKMLARGNPAVVYVDHGKIAWKRTFSSMPANKLLNEHTPLARLSDDFTPKHRLWELLWPYFLLMIILLVVNRLYPVVNFIVNKVKKWRHNSDEDITAHEVEETTEVTEATEEIQDMGKSIEANESTESQETEIIEDKETKE